jgi:Cu-Zn family superoxide dismutase
LQKRRAEPRRLRTLNERTRHVPAPLRATLALTLVVAGSTALGVSAQTTGAKAAISGEGITGTVTLREVPAMTSPSHDMKFMTGMSAVELTVSVTGLKPGAHGFHLHAVGKCEAPGFTTAGGHFDPGPASNPDPDVNHPFHMGDMPNLVADASGKATMKYHDHARDTQRRPALRVRRRRNCRHRSRESRRGRDGGNQGGQERWAQASVRDYH